jgi:hypothetical protein
MKFEPADKKFITLRRPRSADKEVITLRRRRSPDKEGIERKPLLAAGQAERQDPIAAAVAKLEKAWDKYQANADYDRDAVYLYLEPVFNQVRKWKRQGVADEYSLIALKQGMPGRIKADPYLRMLYCSSTKDQPKKRSKWAKVMNWVEDNIKTGELFTEFVKRHGGINKCVESEKLDR